MKGGVAKDRVKTPLHGEMLAVYHHDRQTALLRGGNLSNTGIDAVDAGAGRSYLFRQGTVTASRSRESALRAGAREAAIEILRDPI